MFMRAKGGGCPESSVYVCLLHVCVITSGLLYAHTPPGRIVILSNDEMGFNEVRFPNPPRPQPRQEGAGLATAEEESTLDSWGFGPNRGRDSSDILIYGEKVCGGAAGWATRFFSVAAVFLENAMFDAMFVLNDRFGGKLKHCRKMWIQGRGGVYFISPNLPDKNEGRYFEVRPQTWTFCGAFAAINRILLFTPSFVVVICWTKSCFCCPHGHQQKKCVCVGVGIYSFHDVPTADIQLVCSPKKNFCASCVHQEQICVHLCPPQKRIMLTKMLIFCVH